jgi:hypothetical protein
MSGLRSWKDSMAPRLSLSDGDLADFNMTPLLCEAPQKALTNQYQEIQITELENQLALFQELTENWRIQQTFTFKRNDAISWESFIYLC